MEAKKKKPTNGEQKIFDGLTLNDIVIQKVLSDEKFIYERRMSENAEVRRMNIIFLEGELHRARYLDGNSLTEREAIMVKCLDCMDFPPRERSCPDNACSLHRIMFMS